MVIEFLVCAMALQPVTAQGYKMDFGKEEISVIQSLSYGLTHSDGSRIVVWGNRPEWVSVMRHAGVKAFGMAPHLVKHPLFSVSSESRISIKSGVVDLLLFFGDRDFALELSRIVKPGGFIVFDPRQNPHLSEDLICLGWSRSFSFHAYSVFKHKRGMLPLFRNKRKVPFKHQVVIRHAA